MRQSVETVSPMSNEGRNAYVIGHITDALLGLLREKPLEGISVSELCGRAGVGRASFYRNFSSKEDILRAYIHGLFREWAADGALWEGKALSELLRAMFSHFENHFEFYSLLNQRGLVCLLKDVITGLCGPRPEDPKEAAYSKAYAAYALYGWIELWFQRGMRESADEIAGMFKERGL